MPKGRLRHLVDKEYRVGICLHPRAGPGLCTKVINAHTLQRATTIRRIANERQEVLTFVESAGGQESRLEAEPIGWRVASTFRAFCSAHDDSTFAPLEKQEFSGNKQQLFLLAYRALCHELYQKEASERSQTTILAAADRGLDEHQQRQTQAFFRELGAGISRAVLDLRKQKARFDKWLLEEHFSGISSAVLYFSGPLSVASTGVPSSEFDLDGHRIQDLSDPDTDTQFLAVATVAAPEGGAVALIWETESTAPKRFVDSLLKRPLERIGDLLVEYIFTHIENTYFASAWWDGLSETLKRRITEYAEISNPDLDYPRGSTVGLVEWRLTKVVRT